MKTLITIESSGEIQKIVNTNDPDYIKNNPGNYIDITDHEDKVKLLETSWYFKIKGDKIIEKNMQEKEAADRKREAR
jgi:hypothetical protein